MTRTVEEASLRCVNIELGLSESNIQFRKSKWRGKRTLPIERWNERDLQYSLRGFFTKHHMIGKGYFGAFIIVDPSANISPNKAEVIDWEWVDHARS